MNRPQVELNHARWATRRQRQTQSTKHSKQIRGVCARVKKQTQNVVTIFACSKYLLNIGMSIDEKKRLSDEVEIV